MYYWRKLSDAQRKEVLQLRKGTGLPWHRPPHFDYVGSVTFIISATCFEHQPLIGKNPRRMADFENEIVQVCSNTGSKVFAWCILPNHYHLLVRTDRIEALRSEIGKIHGRTSRFWNLEDGTAGRKVWFNFFDRNMRSDRHYWASVNYVHNNPVRHGYVRLWLDWPYSSVHQYLAEVGREEAERIWREYPILDYGKGWDD